MRTPVRRMAASVTAGILLSRQIRCIIRGFGASPRSGERRLAEHPHGSLVPGQPAGEAAGGHPPVRARPRARDRGVPHAPQPEDPAGEGLGDPRQPPPAQGRRARPLDGRARSRKRRAGRRRSSSTRGSNRCPAPRPRRARQRDLVEYLDSLLGHYRVYESLFIVDPQGTVVAATRDERLEDWMLALAARQRRPAPRPSSARCAKSTFLGRPTMVILRPIAPGLEGRGPRHRVLRAAPRPARDGGAARARTPPPETPGGLAARRARAA